MNEFDLLKKISKKYTDKLVIITVSIDDTYEEMTNYIKNNDYDWIFLHYGNQPNIIKEYDIRGFPTYFLIGPDGKLIFSPAKAPNEYFEIELFKIMKSRGDL